jgi:hypothetical protein
MSDALPQPDPVDTPPHLSPVPVARPIEVSPIHVRANGRCLAAFVVNVDAEDPLSAVFTVDAVVFQPPVKTKDKWEKANTRPGSVRWANNMQHAEVSANVNLTWHYPGQACLPAVVLEMAAKQEGILP